MKKNVFKTMIWTLLPLAFAACGSEDFIEDVPEVPVETPTEQEPEKPADDEPVFMWLPKTTPIDLTAAQKDFVSRINDFSFNFYRALTRQERGSNITSPLSVGYLLGMLNDGAQGLTSDEICHLLGFEAGDKASFDDFCRKLMVEAPQVDPSVTLRIANTVVANKQVELEAPFRQQMEQNYFAGVNSLDFSEPSALEWINGWCNEQTGGMIPKMMEELDPGALMVLMNAVYFNATWSEKFDKEETQEGEFFTGDKYVTLPMMHRNPMTLYAQNDVFSILDLPYGGGENFDYWNMMVLLPNEGKTVDDVVNSLSQATWKETLDNLRMTTVDIKLPRFALQSDIALNDIISGLGAPSMFSPETADFSPMTKNLKRADGNSFFVNLIKQKTAMAVSEEGTELTANTGGVWVHGGPFAPTNFHANRPFVYVIQEASSGAIFFIGTFQGE